MVDAKPDYETLVSDRAETRRALRAARDRKERQNVAQRLASNPMIKDGYRTTSLLQIMYARAEDGWSNHRILEESSRLGRRWNKFTGENLYQDWISMLNMLKTVRKKYPYHRVERKASKK